MKSLLISYSLVILSVLAYASCKNEDIDIREPYLGSYAITAVVTVMSGLTTNTTIDKYTIKIEKGPALNELKITDPSGTYIAKLTGNTFSASTYNSIMKGNGISYAVKSSGNGSFNGNAITINFTAATYTDDIITVWTLTGNGTKSLY